LSDLGHKDWGQNGVMKAGSSVVSVEAVADRRAGSPLAAAVRQFLRSAVRLRSVVSANGFEEGGVVVSRGEAWLNRHQNRHRHGNRVRESSGSD
jgi:hypothetical protein